MSNSALTQGIMDVTLVRYHLRTVHFYGFWIPGRHAVGLGSHRSIRPDHGHPRAPRPAVSIRRPRLYQFTRRDYPTLFAKSLLVSLPLSPAFAHDGNVESTMPDLADGNRGLLGSLASEQRSAPAPFGYLPLVGSSFILTKPPTSASIRWPSLNCCSLKSGQHHYPEGHQAKSHHVRSLPSLPANCHGCSPGGIGVLECFR